MDSAEVRLPLPIRRHRFLAHQGKCHGLLNAHVAYSRYGKLWKTLMVEWIVRLLLFHLLGTITEAVFYWPGWLILRVITGGRFPPNQHTKHNRFAVAIFGVASIVLASAIYTIL
jgi:hypothetical protein